MEGEGTTDNLADITVAIAGARQQLADVEEILGFDPEGILGPQWREVSDGMSRLLTEMTEHVHRMSD